LPKLDFPALLCTQVLLQPGCYPKICVLCT